MLEIVVAIGVVIGIAAMARGRGASPWLAGAIAATGFIVLKLLASLIASSIDTALLIGVGGSWAWLVAVAGFYRFRVGARQPQPAGIWVCPNCTYTNKAYALSCAACKQKWSAPDGG
jgi:hypothetical protein